ncbi:allantoin permease [Helicobacter muridarum]|nr:allantoin permease [Helicobacter muridarum]
MNSNRSDLAHIHTEDESTHIIHDSQKSTRFSLMMAWWGVCSALFYIVVGVAMAQAYGTKNAIIGLLITVVGYSIINGIISRYAIKTGLSVALFSRVLFGHTGAALATLIFFATATYYAIFEGSVIAIALNHEFSSIPYWLGALIVVLYSVPLIFGSVQHWLDKFNGVLLPLYLIGLIGSVIYATIKYGYNGSWLEMGPQEIPEYGWWKVAVYYMGVYVLMMFTFDFARFGKKEDMSFHSSITFGIPFYITAFFLPALVGIYLVSIVPTESLSEAAVAFVFIDLMGFFGLVFVWITQTRINTANFFLATTNMQAFFEETLKLNFSKYVWAIVVGVIVFLIMLTDVFSYLLLALAYQGIFVVSWVAIALAHILNPKREQYFGVVPEVDSNKIPAMDFSGLSAWFISSGIGVWAFNSSWGVNWYATLTFVSAFLLYIILVTLKFRR